MHKTIIQELCDIKESELINEETDLTKRVNSALIYFQNIDLNSNSISNLISDLTTIHGLCAKLEAKKETIKWFKNMKETY